MNSAKEFLIEKHKEDFNATQLMTRLDALEQETLINLLEEYASQQEGQSKLTEDQKQDLCGLIEDTLGSATLQGLMLEDNTGNGFPLVDFLSYEGKTTLKGKEEISNLVEQIYFDLDKFTLPHPHKSVKKLIEKMKDSRKDIIDPDYKIGLNTLNEWIEDLENITPKCKSEGVSEEESMKLICKELNRVFSMGLKQSPTDGDNSDFYAPLIELTITPKLYKKLIEILHPPIQDQEECLIGIDYEQCEYGLNQGTCLGYPNRNKNFKDLEERKDNTCEVCKKDKYLTSTTPDKGLCVCQSHQPKSESKRIEQYYSGLTPKCESEVSDEEIEKEATRRIRNDGTLYGIELKKAYMLGFKTSIKWMQDKLYGNKKECWACFEKLPKGHKSGLCSDCQIRG